MQPTVSITQDLVLVGGGHSHALVLRRLGMKAWPANVRVTLITNLADTPYSGMLPCHISGLYDFDTAHIDLRPLTRFAGCRLIMAEMIGLDPDRQSIFCRDRPPISYDILSIDVGSTPNKSKVLGADRYAIPAKPVPHLLRAWKSYLEQFKKDLDNNAKAVATIAIVGGGVGGVEMAFAMHTRLQQLIESRGVESRGQDVQKQIFVHLFQRGKHLAKGRNRRTQEMVERFCEMRNIVVHTGESVCEVSSEWVRCESGLVVNCDRTFWVTDASAPTWLKDSGLALTDSGFLAVKDTLQTCSHDNIFAAGDVATMVNYPRPKAGVFAVRQGPPLYENLKRYLLGAPLRPFKPQRGYLNIIDTDRESAIASWGMFAIHAKWCRAWKNSIDQKFMRLFSDFPEMSSHSATHPEIVRLRTLSGLQKSFNSSEQLSSEMHSSEMHCAGCGSKVGGQVLTRALGRVRAEAPDDEDWPGRDSLGKLGHRIYAGLEAPDDAAIVSAPLGESGPKLAVQTVDHFSALVDDPFVFGQICVNHCLSDLFAMGATSSHVLALATIPYGAEDKQEEMLYQLLSGAVKALADAKTCLVGGHTNEGADLSLGFACNGWIEPHQIWRKSGMLPGQSLILTKALGTGSLFAADQQRQAKGRWIESAVASMLQSNRTAADCLRAHGATACTDVTGFGLAGHLLEMIAASQVSVRLKINEVARLPGVEKTLQSGIISSLHERNRQNVLSRIQGAAASVPILFDPQTSGGLLASIPSAQTDNCLQDLHRLGFTDSRCIGTITSSAISPGTSSGTLPLDQSSLNARPLTIE
jgi:selenide, water dikinase